MSRPQIFGRDVLNKGHFAAWLGITLDEVDEMIVRHGIPHAAFDGKVPVLFRAPSLLEWRTRYEAKLRQEAAQEAARLQREELHRMLMPRIEAMRPEMEGCTEKLENCDECQQCLAGFSARQRRWAITASKTYGVCVSAISDWAGDWTCPLCGKFIGAGGASLDHNHATGEPRGVICSRCNHGLSFVDCPDWLERAIAYVQPARSARVEQPQNGPVNGVERQETAS